MYIEIASDIIQDALNKAGSGTNESLDLLILFALNAQKGKHIIYVPCLHNNPSVVKDLEKLMGRSHVALLRHSESIYYQLATIKKIVTVYIIISYGQIDIDKKAIVLNPLKEKHFEPYNETHVICENILDAKFFQFVVKFYQRQKNIKQCRTMFIPIMGGGDTTAEVLRHEIDTKQFFCLTIADSDRKYPHAAYGQTAKKLLDLMRNYNPFNCALYIIEQVMEVENLIPNSVVKEHASLAGYIDIFNKDASFYDMKCGLTLNWLYDDEVCQYWRDLLYDVDFDLTERDNAKQQTPCRKKYQDYIESKGYNKVVKRGFGSDLLMRCTNDFDNNGNRLDPKIKDALMKVKVEDLTTFQYNEWMRIGEVLFSWTCGMTSKRAG